MTPEEYEAALVTYKLTGLFTPGMRVWRGFPFPVEIVTVVTDGGTQDVVVSREPSLTGVWIFPRGQLRPTKPDDR